MRCIRQHVDRQFITEEFHPPSLAVCHLRPANAAFVSAFLRHQIICKVLLYGFSVNAQFSAFLPVNIGFFRSEAIPLHPVIIGVEFEHHAEFRHIRQAFDCPVPQCRLDNAVSEHFICKRAAALRFCRHLIPVGNNNTVLPFFHRRAVLRVCPAVCMQIHAADFPLRIALRHIVPAVVVVRCPPEVRHRNGLNQFLPVVNIGGKSRFNGGKLCGEGFPAYADIPFPVYHGQRGIAAVGGNRPLENRLAEGHFVSALRPARFFTEDEGNRHGKFRCFLSERCCRLFQNRHSFREALRQCKALFTQRRNRDEHFLFQILFSVFPEDRKSAVFICIRKKVSVLYRKLHSVKAYGNILIIVFYFLHLRRGLSVPSVYNSVSAEVIVRRPLAVIPAVCLEPFSVPVLFPDGLIHIVPDKAALIPRLPVGQVGIFVHGSAGIPHRVRVLAADKRFLRMLLQKCFDLRNRRVHLAFHVAGGGIASVRPDAFIMHQPPAVQSAEKFAHFIDNFSAV